MYNSAAALFFLSRAVSSFRSILTVPHTRMMFASSPIIRYDPGDDDRFLPSVSVTSPARTKIWRSDKDQQESLINEKPPLFCNDDPVQIRPVKKNSHLGHFSQIVDISDLDEECREVVNVIYDDADIIVLDKPSGVLSVPGFQEKFSLASACAHVYGQSRVDYMVVHRLDRSTSGVIVLARNHDAQKLLQAQFRARSIQKRYNAVVVGEMTCSEGEIDLPLSRHPTGASPWQCVNTARGKASHTKWRVLKGELFQLNPPPLPSKPIKVTHVELKPTTGRSHQLRVHMAAIGHPILGDALYGSSLHQPIENIAGEQPLQNQRERLHLHATSLTLSHPTTRATMTFTATPPF